jgi:hypothetical protein
LWLEKNYPDDKEPFTASTYAKFQFGDLTEEYILFLAELAGHSVQYRQEEVEIDGIKGHWDAIIDGVLVDVKSASSFSFKKFKEGLTPETDGFGYLTQLGSYHYAAVKAGYEVDPDRFAFLAFDKQHGHLCLDIHPADKEKDWEAFFSERKKIVASDEIPPRHYEPIPEGKSGNLKLDFGCSYCDMKRKCWPELRGFKYSYGPVWLTSVVREPNVPEIKEVLTDPEET